MWTFLYAIWGLALGSFIAALTYRLPRNIWTSKGRSFCPNCNHQIAWFDNIPLFSFLFLRGKCRHCKKSISLRYPAIEFAGLLIGLVTPFITGMVQTNISWLTLLPFPAHFLVFGILLLFLAIIITDLEFQIIPDEFVFSLLFLVFVSILLSASQTFFASLAVGFSCALFLLLLHLVTKGRGMGLGDVKLALPVGLLLGYPLGILWLFVSFVSGAVIGLVLMAFGNAGMKTKLAFGPFLVFGAVVTILFGKQLFSFLL
jgi:prepilin signal peptidase PulO-like enzyme (type II secretory pathway)